MQLLTGLSGHNNSKDETDVLPVTMATDDSGADEKVESNLEEKLFVEVYADKEDGANEKFVRDNTQCVDDHFISENAQINRGIYSSNNGAPRPDVISQSDEFQLDVDMQKGSTNASVAHVHVHVPTNCIDDSDTFIDSSHLIEKLEEKVQYELPTLTSHGSSVVCDVNDKVTTEEILYDEGYSESMVSENSKDSSILGDEIEQECV